MTSSLDPIHITTTRKCCWLKMLKENKTSRDVGPGKHKENRCREDGDIDDNIPRPIFSK